VSAEELDEIGMSAALRLATIRAVQGVTCSYNEIIIDGTVNLLSGTKKGEYVTTLPKADGLIPSVSAASIIAKVARDAYMSGLAAVYPQYGFEKNAGYGVESHRRAIEEHGVCAEHRLSFAPLAKYSPHSDVHTSSEMKHQAKSNIPSLGQIGEDAAARYLEQSGYEIINRNWRTKWCEIDIVARKGEILYFIEVKYRQDTAHGDGLAAITSKKLRQMAFASALYMQRYHGNENPQLAAISISGTARPHVDSFIKLT
jgi:ribonuclease HII